MLVGRNLRVGASGHVSALDLLSAVSDEDLLQRFRFLSRTVFEVWIFHSPDLGVTAAAVLHLPKQVLSRPSPQDRTELFHEGIPS
jgi:hypothetical protein